MAQLMTPEAPTRRNTQRRDYKGKGRQTTARQRLPRVRVDEIDRLHLQALLEERVAQVPADKEPHLAGFQRTLQRFHAGEVGYSTAAALDNAVCNCLLRNEILPYGMHLPVTSIE